MDALDDIVSDLVKASLHTKPNSELPSRSRQPATRGPSTNRQPPAVASIPDTSAIVVATLRAAPRSRRQPALPDANSIARAPVVAPLLEPSAHGRTTPQPGSRSRRQSPIPDAEPIVGSPAVATHPEPSANGDAEPKAGQRSRRRARHVAGTIPLSPAATSSDADPSIPDKAGQQSNARQSTGARVGRSSQKPNEAHDKCAAAAPLPDGPFLCGTQSETAIGGDGGAQSRSDTQCAPSPVVAEIVMMWRMRQRWHRAEKSLILQGRALCRAWTEGDKVAANALYDRSASSDLGAIDPELAMSLAPFLAAIQTFAPGRARVEKRLRNLARSLPVWPWVEEARGFGDLNLAGVVGEAGEVGTYRTPSCLWKRMGLAVIDGGRQRRVTDAEAALVHGYNPARRSVAWNIGETLIKANGRYREVYLARKAYEMGREDDGKPASLMHGHKRAARYMTKRALRDLWAAWRAAGRGHVALDIHLINASVGTLPNGDYP